MDLCTRAAENHVLLFITLPSPHILSVMALYANATDTTATLKKVGSARTTLLTGNIFDPAEHTLQNWRGPSAAGVTARP
jgi:hypothetical protein